jgi:hypothetical protein
MGKSFLQLSCDCIWHSWHLTNNNIISEFTVLHPSFKDEYFKLAQWPKEWIDEAIKLTRKMYNKWYKPQNTESVPRPPGKGPARVNITSFLTFLF